MSKISPPADYEIEEARPSRFYGLLPYLLVLVLTLLGVAYTSINKAPLALYWEFVAVLVGVLCVATGWHRAATREQRLTLVWTQVLHWAAFLATMNVLLFSDVSKMLNADSTGLATLLLLALGTFVAGVHTLSWRTCVLGLVMGLAVPVIAWIEESALVIVLACGAFIVLGGLFWWFGRRRSPDALPV